MQEVIVGEDSVKRTINDFVFDNGVANDFIVVVAGYQNSSNRRSYVAVYLVNVDVDFSSNNEAAVLAASDIVSVVPVIVSTGFLIVEAATTTVGNRVD